ncbi:hypothetical protein ES703_107558 [subsurface metagenome]
MNKKQKILTAFMVVALALMFGCTGFQDLITPTYVNTEAAEWAGTTPKMLMPYTTLFDAKRVAAAIAYKLMIEKIKAGYYKNITDLSILAGEEIKSTIFSPEGPVGMMLPMLFGGTIGTMLGGAYKQRPKDKKKIEELEIKNGNKK